MKSDRTSHGYTIVETMIFLAVTAALFVSAIGIFSGTQTRTRFVQSLREIDATIHTTINETQSGFYPNNGSFTCTTTPGNTRPTLSNVANGQGSNVGCIFLGKTMQFGVSNATCTALNNAGCTDYAVHTVIGRQTDGFAKSGTSSYKEVQTLNDPDGAGVGFTGAKPIAGVPTASNPGYPNLAITGTLPGDLRAYAMYKLKNGTKTNIGSVGFITSLAAYSSGSTDPLSGSQSVSLVAINGSSLGENNTSVNNDIQNLSETDRDPDQVVICFSYSGALTTRKGAIVIGGQNHQIVTQVFNDVSSSNIPGNGC